MSQSSVEDLFVCLFFSHLPDKTTYLGRCLKGDATNTKNNKQSLQIISGIYCTNMRDRVRCERQCRIPRQDTVWDLGEMSYNWEKHNHSCISPVVVLSQNL